MKLAKRQDGYTLLITLVLIILFVVLGMSLMSLTSSGIAKNEVRQDITRSASLSDKGIDRITSEINTELTNELDRNNGLPRDAFISKLGQTLDKYKCGNSTALNSVPGETGKFGVCIEDIENTIDENDVENPLRKLVTFVSVGESGSKERALVSQMEIGADNAPEILKYAIGTNIDPTDGYQKGEGNLLLHGGVHIQGDMKVDGNIITRNKGYAYLNGEQWIDSLFPSTKPTHGAETARLVLGKKAYTFNSNLGYDGHISSDNFEISNYTNRTDNISALFRTGYAPEVVIRNPVRSPIGISDKKAIYKYERLGANRILETGSTRVITPADYPNLKVFPSYTRSNNRYTDTGTFELRGNNKFKQFSTLGNLNITNNNSNITVSDGLYIEGNLSIGNGKENVNDFANVSLEGTMFVNGNVTIKGAALKNNVLMYVNGNVDIQYSTMNGKSLNNGKTGTFIIFAKGNIKISNNSVNQDTPSLIKGFFYSEKDLEMFGVGSNIKIEGGISARRIVLNAIRGQAKNQHFAGSQNYSYGSQGHYFEGETKQGQNGVESRFQIIYDPEIISTYSDLRQQEPIIYNIDPPVEKDRSF